MPTILLRAAGPVLLTVHLSLNLFPTLKGVWSELLFYNLVSIFAVIAVLKTPQANDRLAALLIATAIALWSLGSLLSTLTMYYWLGPTIQIATNTAYLLFYPFAILGIPRLISLGRKFSLLERFDGLIIGLGLLTLGIVLFLEPVLPNLDAGFNQNFFSLSFPLADLLLISITLVAVLARGFSLRSLMLVIGVLTFTITDFLYLGMHLRGGYSVGSPIDDGWLLGLVLISLSFWFRGSDSIEERGSNPSFIALSVFLSATLLALIALRPGYFPIYILFPAIATLLLAFIRMTLALRASRYIGHERILARTDELTGLPNRRKLISEIEIFMDKAGSLLLLDLDGFKPVNDSFGHATGDKVLQQVALRFSRTLPQGALLARLGGDEFGVLHEGGYESSMDLALALRATLSYPFRINNENIHIGVSIGVAVNNGTPDLLQRADDAMYRAKREGIGVCRL